jgi:hypothetical protein
VPISRTSHATFQRRVIRELPDGLPPADNHHVSRLNRKSARLIEAIFQDVIVMILEYLRQSDRIPLQAHNRDRCSVAGTAGQIYQALASSASNKQVDVKEATRGHKHQRS